MGETVENLCTEENSRFFSLPILSSFFKGLASERIKKSNQVFYEGGGF